MGFFIRSDAKPYEKVLGISILTVLAFSFAGMFSRFIPSETYHFYASIISIPIATVVFSLTIYQIKNNVTKYHNQGKSYMTGWLIYPLFALLWLFFSYLALTLGVPSLLNHTLASKHEQTVTVVKKTKGGVRGLCGYRIHTKELKSVLSKGLCTSREFYDYIKLGDQLQLTGQKSWLGITVEGFHKQKNNENWKFYNYDEILSN